MGMILSYSLSKRENLPLLNTMAAPTFLEVMARLAPTRRPLQAELWLHHGY
ncbi:hypothetical protein Goari_016998 [Gossypium aridum]|uniref:Uncharacterized protein n=1 Tax=Gossypium aridum TaxID=34290 RepID=A0A7J8WLA2_GOSAI|nr:hypothetical protein [Gossypium aridum]